MEHDKIIVRGAKEHNLKNVNVEIPRNKLVVITGLSGSGKSSLAFDTIYAEGQRRYVESLSSYARMFLGQMDKPNVESIEGLSPAISIDQKTTSKNPRSTVGTVTEIYDYLRLLYARVGIPHCPVCGREIRQQTVDQIVDKIMSYDEGTKIQVLAPVVRGRKGEHVKVLESARKSGFARVRADGIVYDLSEKIPLEKNKKHNILLLILLILTSVIILSLIFINYYSNKAYPILKSYAESETKKLTVLIINKAITKQLYDIDVEELFKITYNKDGEIILIDFDTKKTSKALSTMTSLVELNLRAVEEGKIDMLELPENSLSNYNMELLSKKIICEIPFGLTTGSSLLSNIGPKIPVKISLIGDVSTNFSTEVVEYGINNALLKVLVNISVTTRVILPISTEDLNISASIPIGMKVVQGKIPNYYLNGFEAKSNIVEWK